MKRVVNIDAGAMCGCTTSADFICGDLPHDQKARIVGGTRRSSNDQWL